MIPTPVDIAFGRMYGIDPEVPVLPAGRPGARRALEAAVLQGLQRPPCVVSFSGGRDSSLVLAVAAAVARREGLPLPVPVTLRFPDVASADEREWQELVVGHVGVPDWEQLTFTDELDAVGPIASELLRRHGVLFPANAHFHIPIAAAARGGTVLTGFGGDELLQTSVWLRLNLVLTRRLRPRRSDALRLLLAAVPPARAAAYRRRHGMAVPASWLRPAATERMSAARLADQMAEPVRWDRSLRVLWWRSRYRLAAEHALTTVVGGQGAAVISPLTSAGFLTAVAAERVRLGYASREEGMEHLVGDLLPRQLLARHTKGRFDGAIWGPYAEDFMSTWDGSGVDEELVDVAELRRSWREVKDARTLMLLQSAWLAQLPEPAHEEVGGRLE
jgi:asparagine synthetase B (glutamine-hydrolysing)